MPLQAQKYAAVCPLVYRKTKALRLPFPGLDLEPQAAAVRTGSHQPIQVCPKDGRMPGRQPCQDVRMWVAEPIFKPGRDQGYRRRNRLQEGLDARCARAVVA